MSSKSDIDQCFSNTLNDLQSNFENGFLTERSIEIHLLMLKRNIYESLDWEEAADNVQEQIDNF